VKLSQRSDPRKRGVSSFCDLKKITSGWHPLSSVTEWMPLTESSPTQFMFPGA
jgi:hypothetical protein